MEPIVKLKFNTQIKLGKTVVTAQSPVFIIAEAGVNHNGRMDLAFSMIDKAKECGADAVKFQAFKTEELILESIDKAPYQKRTTGENESQYEMLKKLELTSSQFLELKEYCDKKDILFLITPFDDKSLESLDNLDLSAYKISSTDLTNLPFLKKVAKKNKPIILSTGMSYLEEVTLALNTIEPFNKNVILLHCTGNYPTQDNEVNLNVLKTFQEEYEILVGYSDHTPGLGASAYAVPLGAKVLEKHFTLDKKMMGPDHEASLDIPELRRYIENIRRVESYMGSLVKQPQASEQNTRKSLQKSFVARQQIKKGEPFTENNIVAKRCGGKGVSPIHAQKVLAAVAPKDFEKNEIIIYE